MSKPTRKSLFGDKKIDAEFRQFQESNAGQIEAFLNASDEGKVLLYSVAEFMYGRTMVELKKAAETLRLLQEVKDEQTVLTREIFHLGIPTAERRGELKALIENNVAIEAQESRRVGGKVRSNQQAREKRKRHALIQKTEDELATTTPAHKLNKEIAKVTGQPTDSVRKARKMIKKKSATS